ncbi:MAG: hypothetical protein ACE5I1_26780 [bacterium]
MEGIILSIAILLIVLSGLGLIVGASAAQNAGVWRRMGGIISGIMLLIGSLLFLRLPSAYMALLNFAKSIAIVFETGLSRLFPVSTSLAWGLFGMVVAFCITLWLEAPTYGFRKIRRFFVFIPFALLLYTGYLGYTHEPAQAAVKTHLDKMRQLGGNYARISHTDTDLFSRAAANSARTGLLQKGILVRLVAVDTGRDGSQWWFVEAVDSPLFRKPAAGYVRNDFLEPEQTGLIAILQNRYREIKRSIF